QTVQVARFELVRVGRQGFAIGDAEVGRASREVVMENQRAQGGVSACTGTTNRKSIPVDLTLFGKIARGADTVRRIDDAPVAIHSPAVGPSVPAAAPIVHVHHPEPTTGPVLDAETEGDLSHRRRTTVTDHDEGSTFASWSGGFGIGRRVVDGVGRRGSILGG